MGRRRPVRPAQNSCSCWGSRQRRWQRGSGSRLPRPTPPGAAGPHRGAAAAGAAAAGGADARGEPRPGNAWPGRPPNHHAHQLGPASSHHLDLHADSGWLGCPLAQVDLQLRVLEAMLQRPAAPAPAAAAAGQQQQGMLPAAGRGEAAGLQRERQDQQQSGENLGQGCSGQVALDEGEQGQAQQPSSPRAAPARARGSPGSPGSPGAPFPALCKQLLSPMSASAGIAAAAEVVGRRGVGGAVAGRH
jgi:hypothetical protein